MMNILGIDPAINKTGWAVISKNGSEIKYIAGGVINTNPGDNLFVRLGVIMLQMQKILDQYKPTIAGVEETFLNKNPASSLKLAHARGALGGVLGAAEIEVFEFAPRLIKKNITGNGNAEKNQVMHMVKLIFGVNNIGSYDHSDALAIAYSASLRS